MKQYLRPIILAVVLLMLSACGPRTYCTIHIKPSGDNTIYKGTACNIEVRNDTLFITRGSPQ